jgi:hypothetical protein
MLTIWKYEIPIQDNFELLMQRNAKILAVQTQFEVPCIWCLVDPKEKMVQRRFRVAGTGHDIKEDPLLMIYVGTFQTNGGAFIGHLFETKE